MDPRLDTRGWQKRQRQRQTTERQILRQSSALPRMTLRRGWQKKFFVFFVFAVMPPQKHGLWTERFFRRLNSCMFEAFEKGKFQELAEKSCSECASAAEFCILLIVCKIVRERVPLIPVCDRTSPTRGKENDKDNGRKTKADVSTRHLQVPRSTWQTIVKADPSANLRFS